jgi:hypothetical protein
VSFVISGIVLPCALRRTNQPLEGYALSLLKTCRATIVAVLRGRALIRIPAHGNWQVRIEYHIMQRSWTDGNALMGSPSMMVKRSQHNAPVPRS